MLYNIISNSELKSTYAIPVETGGINDIAFENGWRILQHAVSGKYVAWYLRNREYQVIADVPKLIVNDVCYNFLTTDEWNSLIQTMYTPEDSLLLVDSPMFSQYVEEQPDEPEDEYGEWAMLDEPETNDADTQCEVPHDFVEEFHALNQQ